MSDQGLGSLFPGDPILVQEPEWAVEETLGLKPAKKYIRAAFYAQKGSRPGVALGSNAVLRVDPPEGFGTVIETRFSIMSSDIAKCLPVEILCTITAHLTEDPDGTKPIFGSVRIAAVWPKPGQGAPVSVRRKTTSEDKIGVDYAGIKGQIGDGTEWVEEYQRVVPDGVLFVGEPASPRLVTWGVRGTPDHPGVEGNHYAGLWLTHPSQCWARVTITVEVKAEVEALGTTWRNTLQPAGNSSEPFELIAE